MPVVVLADCFESWRTPSRMRRLSDWDADEAACHAARDKSGRQVYVASASAVPFQDNSFHVIFSADLLCHANVDELESLRNFHRCLREERRRAPFEPSGILVVDVRA